MRREPQCAACNHERSTHHREYESSGRDVNQTREPVWYACLATFCGCMKYYPPRED
jgi:hypothetical protein